MISKEVEMSRKKQRRSGSPACTLGARRATGESAGVGPAFDGRPQREALPRMRKRPFQTVVPC
jgi:hypothetical protein